jgi:hypothetical protein
MNFISAILNNDLILDHFRSYNISANKYVNFSHNSSGSPLNPLNIRMNLWYNDIIQSHIVSRIRENLDFYTG